MVNRKLYVFVKYNTGHYICFGIQGISYPIINFLIVNANLCYDRFKSSDFNRCYYYLYQVSKQFMQPISYLFQVHWYFYFAFLSKL